MENDNYAEQVEAELRDVLGPTRALRNDLTAERVALRQRIEQLDAAIRRVDKVLAAVEPTPPKQKQQSRPVKPAVSEEKVAAVWAAMSGREAMTANEIASIASISTGTVRAALTVLRAEQRVRLAGARANSHGLAPKLYALMEEG